MNTQIQQPIWTKSFIGISTIQLMIFTIFYALLTTLPLYVINVMGGSVADGGLVVTVMLISTIFIRSVSAKILDKIGKKRALLISLALFTFTTFFYIWIDALIPLLILRFIHGLSYGVASTATGAIAADVLPSKRHGEGIGYFAMASNLAVVIGPFIGLSLIQFVSFQTLYMILSVLMVGGALFAIFVQVPPQVDRVAPKPMDRKLSINDFIERKALPVAIIAGLASFAYASIISFISVYADSIGLAEVASYFFVVYAIAMLVSRPYMGKAFDKHGPNRVIIPSLLIFASGFIMLSFTGNAWMLLLSAALIGLGFGTIVPSFQTMAIQAAHPSRTGHATATFFMLFDTGIAVGSFVCGLIVASFGFQNLYIIYAVLILVVLGLFLFVQSAQKEQIRSNQL